MFLPLHSLIERCSMTRQMMLVVAKSFEIHWKRHFMQNVYTVRGAKREGRHELKQQTLTVRMYMESARVSYDALT